jgi:hypothetical protein
LRGRLRKETLVLRCCLQLFKLFFQNSGIPTSGHNQLCGIAVLISFQRTPRWQFVVWKIVPIDVTAGPKNINVEQRIEFAFCKTYPQAKMLSETVRNELHSIMRSPYLASGWNLILVLNGFPRDIPKQPQATITGSVQK